MEVDRWCEWSSVKDCGSKKVMPDGRRSGRGPTLCDGPRVIVQEVGQELGTVNPTEVVPPRFDSMKISRVGSK